MSKTRSASSGRAVLPVLALWIVVYVCARWLLEAELVGAPGVRLGLAVAPVPVFALLLWTFVSAMRGADELERRIQLEALAIAFPLGLLLLSTLGLLERAQPLPSHDWSYDHVWPMFVLLYIVGVALARRRYA